MDREDCWVWFKGSLNEEGYWKGGFTYEKDNEPGLLIKSRAYVPCRVPEWRISRAEPADKHKGPDIPINSPWKII